jgi:hypothetical protein
MVHGLANSRPNRHIAPTLGGSQHNAKTQQRAIPAMARGSVSQMPRDCYTSFSFNADASEGNGLPDRFV